MLEEWLPKAVEIGIPYKEFFKMTPNAIRVTAKHFASVQESEWERAEYQAWLIGNYVQFSIGACLSKKIKYPNNPLEEKQKRKMEIEEQNLTEEQKDFYRNQFLKRLQRMEKRFNRSKEQLNGTEIVLNESEGRME